MKKSNILGPLAKLKITFLIFTPRSILTENKNKKTKARLERHSGTITFACYFTVGHTSSMTMWLGWLSWRIPWLTSTMALNLTTTKIVPVTHFLVGTGVDSGISLPTTVMHVHTEYSGLWSSIEIHILGGVGWAWPPWLPMWWISILQSLHNISLYLFWRPLVWEFYPNLSLI